MNVFYIIDFESSRRDHLSWPSISRCQPLRPINSKYVQHFLFFITRFMTGFLTYTVCNKFLSSKSMTFNRKPIFLASLFAGFFYSYNPISTTMVSTTVFFAFSYSLLPLIFYYFDNSLTKKQNYNVLLVSLLFTLSVASTIQFIVLVPLFVLFPWFIINLLKRLHEKENVVLTFKNTLLSILFSLAISFYWIIVIVHYYFRDIQLTHPDYVLTFEMLQVFSNKLSITNIFRLLGDWLPRVKITPPAIIVDQSLWTVLTFFIPITIVLFILFSRQNPLRFVLISFSLFCYLL